jgi:hypothetical protein
VLDWDYELNQHVLGVATIVDCFRLHCMALGLLLTGRLSVAFELLEHVVIA